jgi:hypothetical protein
MANIGDGCLSKNRYFHLKCDIIGEYMEESNVVEFPKYTVYDELNFIASIASNGTLDRNGMLKTEFEMEEFGIPNKSRTCIERIQFLDNYVYQWKNRDLPTGWGNMDKAAVLNYINLVAIPTIKALREVQLGDLV